MQSSPLHPSTCRSEEACSIALKISGNSAALTKDLTFLGPAFPLAPLGGAGGQNSLTEYVGCYAAASIVGAAAAAAAAACTCIVVVDREYSVENIVAVAVAVAVVKGSAWSGEQKACQEAAAAEEEDNPNMRRCLECKHSEV